MAGRRLGPGLRRYVGRLRCGTMKLEGIPFQTIDWSRVEPTSHPGAPGLATWRTILTSVV